MKKQMSSFLLVSLGAAALAAGCTSAPAPSAGTGGHVGTGSGGSTTGSGGSTTGSGGQVGTGMGVALTPSATGFVAADSNSLMVVGSWYSYGDGQEGGVPPGKCQMALHPTADCSVITAPPPGAASFAPDAMGRMCTAGTAAKVVAPPGMPATAFDYSNMYGAGIGLDLNNIGGPNSVKAAFNATAKGVTGISFDIDTPPLAGLRVEFPTMGDNPVAGADYWGATPDGKFPNSKVVAGTNTVHFATDVTTPMAIAADAGAHVFNPSTLVSIQFHVPTNTSMAGMYAFCISNLKLLTN